MADRIRVTTGSRLHFGLLSFGGNAPRQFGGAGVMLAEPAIVVEATPADEFTVAGDWEARVSAATTAWVKWAGHEQPPACRLEVHTDARLHHGLGVGTQVALATAVALNTVVGQLTPGPAELAQSVGRGVRSAVGTYGFAQGGLIVEQGKAPQESIAPLHTRVALPDSWRFVLVCPPSQEGLSGGPEQAAFDGLPAVTPEVTAALWTQLHDHLLPAIANADHAAFAASLTRYGRMAGECFASVQGGPYSGPRLARIVEILGELGAIGVGQSSWGPTLFAAAESEGTAEALVDRIRVHHELANVDTRIVTPRNNGAAVQAD